MTVPFWNLAEDCNYLSIIIKQLKIIFIAHVLPDKTLKETPCYYKRLLVMFDAFYTYFITHYYVLNI